jgi:hypothetical protein
MYPTTGNQGFGNRVLFNDPLRKILEKIRSNSAMGFPPQLSICPEQYVFYFPIANKSFNRHAEKGPSNLWHLNR